MKNIFVFCFIILRITSAYSQDNILDSTAYYDKVFLVAQQKPKFPGEVSKWVAEHTVYPKQASDSNIQGTVYLSIIIEKDGSVSGVKVMKGVQDGSSLDSEAAKVVSAMPKWIPGRQNGKTVRVQCMIPVNFVLRDSIESKKKENAQSLTSPIFGIDINDYLKYNLNYPEDAFRNKIEGTAVVSFVVEKDGAISHVKIKNSVSPAIDKEAMRIISIMPLWKPGMQNGKPIRVQLDLPVKFELPSYERAKFPGNLYSWINKELKYPEEAKRNKKEGEVYVQFVIEADGSISNIWADHEVKGDEMLVKEAKRIVSVMPKWHPAYKNYKTINEEATLRIVFNLRDDSIAKAKLQLIDTDVSRTEINGDSLDDTFFSEATIPQFIGNLDMYLEKNIHYPSVSRNIRRQGTVYVSFVVEKDGSISNVYIIYGVDSFIDEEAYRVVQDMPKWIPGKLNGQPIRVQFMLPIRFVLK